MYFLFVSSVLSSLNMDFIKAYFMWVRLCVSAWTILNKFVFVMFYDYAFWSVIISENGFVNKLLRGCVSFWDIVGIFMHNRGLWSRYPSLMEWDSFGFSWSVTYLVNIICIWWSIHFNIAEIFQKRRIFGHISRHMYQTLIEAHEVWVDI